METKRLLYEPVLVAGATGFLGRSLVPRLCQDGYKVTAIGLSSHINPFMNKVEYIQVDLTDADSVREILNPWRWHAVINLAGYASKKITTFPHDYPLISAHVLSALNLCLNIPTNWTGRLIHISGMNVYGIPRNIPVTESHPFAPVDVYGAGKALSEEIITAISRIKAIDLCILRLPGLFSEERRGGALYNFIQAAMRGEPLIISATRPTPWDVLHVEDAVEAIVRTLQLNRRCLGAINISYGEPVELETIARRIVEIVGSNSKVLNPEGVKHPVFQMDISRARKFLNWPPYTLQQRLERLCHHLAMEGMHESGS